MNEETYQALKIVKGFVETQLNEWGDYEYPIEVEESLHKVGEWIDEVAKEYEEESQGRIGNVIKGVRK